MSSFHKCPSLPAEIRIQIWNCFHELTPACIYNLIETPNCELRALNSGVKEFRSPQFLHERMKKVPEILHVCRESRALGLQSYSLGFEFPHEFERGIPLNPIGESTFTGV